MNKLATSLIAIVATLSALAAVPQPDQAVWYDGWAFYSCQERGRELVFMGGTPHEGGYGFILTPASAGKYTIRSNYDDVMDNAGTSGRPACGSTVAVRVVGDQTVMVVTTAGVVTDVLLSIDSDISSEIVDDQYKLVDGVYRAPDGTTVAFDGRGNISFSKNADQWQPYKTLECYEIPSNVIEVGKNKATAKYYQWKPTYNGLILEEVEIKSNGDWYGLDDTEGTETVKTWYLTKTRGVRFVGDGLWPVTSQRVLTCGYFSDFDQATLRFMRNEIFARHGYIFKSDDLRNHFEAQPWYKPVTADVSKITLTEIEQLNVAAIKRVEKLMADNPDGIW